MKYTGGILPLNSQKPGIQLLVSLIVILGVSLVLLSLTILLGWIFFGMGINDLSSDLGSISSQERAFIKFTQAFQHISIFLVPTLAVAYLMSGKIGAYLKIKTWPGTTQSVLAIILSFILIPVIGELGIWNLKLELPHWLGGLETWMENKESQAELLTGWLIYSDSTGGLLLNILILALIPAVGEEFLFRGVFQQIFYGLFRSGHLAILATSVIFSMLHFQFFGFVPRMALGIVYGYLFFWSGKLWLPVLAHFINNLVPVMLSHFYGWESINSSIEDLMQGRGNLFFVPLIMCGLLMLIIWDQSRRPNSDGQ